MNRSKLALVGLTVAMLLGSIPAINAAIQDFSWTFDGLQLSNGVITGVQDTGHGTAANTFDRDYTVTATCVVQPDHTSVIFCGPEARQTPDAPSTFTQEAYALYIHGFSEFHLRIHRLGAGTSQRVLAEADFTPTPGVEYVLTLTVDGTSITGCVSGGPCLFATDSVLTEGSAGVGIRASLSSNPSPEIIDFSYSGDPIPAPGGYDGRFSDDDGNVHEGMIEAIAAEGITQGCSAAFPSLYCPFDLISRDQMASFIARALDLTSSGFDWFDDDTDNTHETNINAIADDDITLGCGPPRTYCPYDLVTRAQMASFIERAFDLPPSDTDWFPDDDGLVHEDAINALADAGITLGCQDGLFCPNEFVPRDQMASFIGRALGLEPVLLRSNS